MVLCYGFAYWFPCSECFEVLHFGTGLVRSEIDMRFHYGRVGFKTRNSRFDETSRRRMFGLLSSFFYPDLTVFINFL